MKTYPIACLLLAALFLSSCTLRKAGATLPPTPIEADQGQPVVTLTPTPTSPIASPTSSSSFQVSATPAAPTNPPVLSPTATTSTAMVTPKSEAVNCRFGPGTNYFPSGGLKVGASVPILGQTVDGTWWQIQNPNNIFENCWVSAAATNISGNIASIPIIPVTAAFVTLVTVDPPAPISVPGCMGSIQPIKLTGSIDVNGPVTLTYHFATQQGLTLAAHTLTVSTYGPVSVNDSFTPALVAGTYWVKLFITAPNSLTAQANYTISCP